jgi:poly(A) polymerase
VFEHGLRVVEAMDVMLAPERPSGDSAWMWDELWRVFAWCEAELRGYLGEQMSEGRSRGSLLKLAGLLHDVAKPQTRELRDGRVRFFGHADIGADVAARVLRRYRFSAREVRFVSVLVAEHLRPVQLAQVGEVPTRRALYRFHRDLGDAARAVLLLALADAAAARGPGMRSEGWARHVGYMNRVLVRSHQEEGIVDAPRLLTGRDIIDRLGLPPGPVIGRLLEALREAQAAGDVTELDGALAFVRQMARDEADKARGGR